MNFEPVTHFLDALSTRGIAGADLAVAVDGKMVYRHMTGMADCAAERAIAEDTLYRMYSMTKPVTCAAALQLYEQGRFLLTDPLYEYLPEYRDMLVCPVKPNGQPGEPAPAKNPIRLADLFSMSSGLNYDLESPSLLRLRQETGGNYTTRAFARAVSQEPLSFEPGTHWQYSLSHDVLGAVVEVISGKTLGEYFHEFIFSPLGMQNTWFRVPEGEAHRRACTYEPHPGEEPRLLPDVNVYQRGNVFESGGAGLSSTVDDYLRFASTMANLGQLPSGARILGRGTVELMRQNQLDPVRMADFDWIQFQGYGYGLGVRTLIDPARAGALGGPGEFGWGGAAGTYLLMHPERRLSVVYAQQALPSDEPYIHPRLRNLIYHALEA